MTAPVVVGHKGRFELGQVAADVRWRHELHLFSGQAEDARGIAQAMHGTATGAYHHAAVRQRGRLRDQGLTADTAIA